MFENKLEQQIIQLYDSNLVNLFSINQISKNLNKKYPYINKKVSQLLKKGIMKKIVVGRSYLCTLNFENPRTLLLLALNEINKKKPVIAGEITEFIKNSSLQVSVLSAVVFNKSLLFVVNDMRDRRPIQRRFPDAMIVDKQAMLDMLSVNKEFFTSHVVIYGYENFFSLLRLELEELKRLYSPLKY